MSNDKGKLVFGTNNVFSNKNKCHIKLVISHGIPITVNTNQNSHNGGVLVSQVSYCWLYIYQLYPLYHHSIACYPMLFVWLFHVLLVITHRSPYIPKIVVGANPIKSHGKSPITMSMPFPIICPHIFPWFAHFNPHTVSDFPAIHVWFGLFVSHAKWGSTWFNPLNGVHEVPSGKRTVCYWKWWFIVGLTD